MAQWTKALLNKPDNPSSVSTTHMVEEENQPLHASYESIHNKYFKIHFILFLFVCMHVYITYV